MTSAQQKCPVHAVMLTDRARMHQQLARDAAPSLLELVILRRPEPVEMRWALARAEIVISERNQPVSAQMIAAAPKLRYILRLGSLVHGIDLEAAHKAGVKVSAQPVRECVLAAEHVLMMCLAVLRRLGRSLRAMTTSTPEAAPRMSDENSFAYNWMDYGDLQPLLGRTVAVLGMGEIGVELTSRLAAFGPAAILYHKRVPYPSAVELALGLEHASFERCVRDADVLVSLLPFTVDTKYLLGQAAFDTMPAHAVLVHAGSGGVIDEAALAATLAKQRIAGAALDNFEVEPLPLASPLLKLVRDGVANLLLTPHIASGTLPSSRAGDFAEIERFLRSERLHFDVHT
ncbi:MAG: NAD(P)-dependent oxidoreductase [Gammaproteobacteria bacterium]